MSTTPLDAWAVTAPGVESLTARELAALGIVPGAAEPGGVQFRADLGGVMRANLHLRTAVRVVVRVAAFRASAFYELERKARRVPWEGFVPPGAALRFRVTSRKSRLYHEDGIAERLAEAAGGGTAGSGLVQEFVVRIFRDVVTISADSSGALLHQRGYRLATAKAPLRETLAAAMLLGAGWDGTAPLIDPMCGSGTIPIEAALLARRIPPGRRRHFAFEHWPSFDPALWGGMLADADALALPRSPVAIAGSDRDAGAIEAAAANADRAGVTEDVVFRRVALSAIELPPGPGWIITNPPYGHRVGEAVPLRDLFARFGQVLRNRCPGWRAAILSANRMLEGQTGLPWEEVFRTTNGGIRVRLVVTPGIPAEPARL
jgi:putative N6-adenine-specific DNA methylase